MPFCWVPAADGNNEGHGAFRGPRSSAERASSGEPYTPFGRVMPQHSEGALLLALGARRAPPAAHEGPLVVVLRHLPRHTDALLLAHHVDRHRLPNVVGAQNAHRVRRGGRLAATDRENHVAALERQRAVGRALDHQHAVAGPEVAAEIGVETDEIEIAPAVAEAERETVHLE